ncbi:MAG: ATP-binding cassette domain-containing protein [Lachnospiraceae bacterium]|nr:ATP-binding cassette domain-containing protein [Lachnospiraceae bacterium]
MAIELKEVTKKLNGNTVTDNVSVIFHPGEIAGLKGINGSGKTMLMRLISGLIFPTKGKILINGEELGKEISFPRSLGILIENPAFLDYCSGFQNLKLLASIKNIITDREINDTLIRVGLDPNDKKKYKKYSLGMKQRLGIAAAIMESPDIVILDEPTNSLDTEGIALVKQILAEEKQRGATVIISCHDSTILTEMSDIVYTISNGRLFTGEGVS